MRADYIVVGSGSAGAALAYRLSESGKYSVIVLEHGGSDIGPFIQMPAALSYPMNMRRYDWGYVSEAAEHLNHRRLVTPRGKVIGGSSSINGMIYVRGNALDYEAWQDAGAEGWDYQHVLPYFKRMEHWHDGGQGGDPAWRGRSGPLHVTRGPRKNPLDAAFVKAGAEAGFLQTDDYNGEQQEGFGPFDQTVWKGRRWSTANAYLKPALKRKNCSLLRALATRVLFEDKKAIGVEAIHKGQALSIFADREVVLAAGAINSPKLLLQSGIGPASALQALGIDVIADRQGVGENLQDHLEVYLQDACSQPVSLYKYWSLLGKAWVGANWLFFKRGVGTSNNFESAAFLRSAAGVAYPDIQFHFLPIAVRYDGQASSEGHGYQIHAGPMRSASRGNITLRSADPLEAPKIQFNYMSDEADWQNFRTAIRYAKSVFAQDAFKPYRKKAIQPLDDQMSDEALDDFIRANAESAYHPCGTAAMGAVDDPMAVVDPTCRVIGVEGLRLADSSIFPQITNGNLNAPSIMVGEKASDHILGQSLAPDPAKPWVSPNWQSSDR